MRLQEGVQNSLCKREICSSSSRRTDCGTWATRLSTTTSIFWRNGHSVRMLVFDDSSPANQEKYYPLLEQTRTHNDVYYVRQPGPPSTGNNIILVTQETWNSLPSDPGCQARDLGILNAPLFNVPRRPFRPT
jgi:hypothetical protein